MPKTPLSATIEKTTDDTIREIAKKEKRSLSSMVDILLQIAIPIFKEKN